jgi:hypothetical protein
MPKITTDYIVNNKWEAQTRKQRKALTQSDKAGRVAEGYSRKHHENFDRNGRIIIEPYYCLLQKR